MGKLRTAYEKKVSRLEDRLLRAEQAIEREGEQATQSKVDTALSVGTAILGALLGRKRVSATSVGRAGTAARRAGNMRKQSADVKRAQARATAIEQDLDELRIDFEDEVAVLEDAYDAQTDELKEIVVRARSTNIQVKWLGIQWRPSWSGS